MKNFINMKVLKLWKTFRESKASRTRKAEHVTHQCELASRAGAGGPIKAEPTKIK